MPNTVDHDSLDRKADPLHENGSAIDGEPHQEGDCDFQREPYDGANPDYWDEPLYELESDEDDASDWEDPYPYEPEPGEGVHIVKRDPVPTEPRSYKPLETKIGELPEYWSLEMVAVWIHTRDAEKVRRHLRDFAIMRLPSEGRRSAIPLLTFRDAALFGFNNWPTINLDQTHYFSSYYDFDAVWQSFPPLRGKWYSEFISFLRRGGCEVSGLPNDADDAKEIYRATWSSASFAAAATRETVLRVRGKAAFSCLEFKAVDILKEYPPDKLKYLPWSWAKTRKKPLGTNVQWLLEELKFAYKEGFPMFHLTDAIRDREIREKIFERYKGHEEDIKYPFAERTERAFTMLVRRLIEEVFGKV